MDEIFRKYFFTVRELLQNCGITYPDIMDFDVAAAVYVISDYAVLSANGDRYFTDKKMNDEFKYLFIETNYGEWSDGSENAAFMLSCAEKGYYADREAFSKFKKAIFDMRIDFYIQMVREGPKCNLCMPLDDSLRDNAMYSVTTAFVNCVHTPAYVEKYGNAPIQLRSIEEQMQLSKKLFLPLYKTLTDLFVEVSEFVRKFNERNSSPLPRQYDPAVTEAAKEFEDFLSSSNTMNTPYTPTHPRSNNRSYFWGMVRLGAYLGGAVAIIWIIIELFFG